jgi:hypothetical protein
MAQNTDQQQNSGPSEYIEQFVTNIYEWIIQMMYVFYDEKHYATILGQEKASEQISLMNTDLFDKSITVSVKPGSLQPKDPITQQNQAIDLFQAKALDLISLYEKLDFPNPKQTAERVMAMQMDPVAYIQGKSVEEIVQAKQQQGQPPAPQGGQPQPTPQQPSPQPYQQPNAPQVDPTEQQSLLAQIPVAQ